MKTFAFSAAVLATLCAGQVFAQGQTNPTRPAQPATRPGATAQTEQQTQSNSQQMQQHAAACLLIGNQEEIALSEMGIERGESDEVKEFGREMVKEHTKFISKLRKFTPQQASFELNVKADDAASSGKNTTQKEGEAAVRSGETTAAKASGAAAGSMQDHLLMMKRDKAQECLKLTKENLEEHKGADFDKAFMGTQVSAHISMLAELRAMKQHVSGEFAELVTEGEKSAEKHLDHAKEIMEKIASSGSESRESGRENDRERPAPRQQRNPRSERPSGGREG